MTFLAPIFLVAGAAVAGAIVLLHFLARRRPRPAIFPTARFVPDRPARWPSRAPRPTEWLLLALRVLAVAAVAAAFAQPVRDPKRRVTTRIVLVDRSRGVADERAMRDSVRAVVREGDVLVAFDTVPRVVPTKEPDGIAAITRSSAPSSFSAALIAAQRAAATVRSRTDSIELAVVSPFASEAWDAATWGLRTRWPGRVRLVTLPLARGDTVPRGIGVRAAASDPVHAAARPFASAGELRTLIVRGDPLATDSVWARRAGHVLVHWPAVTDSAPATADAVVAPAVVLVAPIVRRAIGAGPGVRIVARFGDGGPAIVEQAHGEGCIRNVGFDFPAAGDVPLRESARTLMRVVGAPCEDDAPRDAMSAGRLDSLRGTGPLVQASALPRPQERSAATSWLLIAGALLLLAEVAMRRRVGRA